MYFQAGALLLWWGIMASVCIARPSTASISSSRSSPVPPRNTTLTAKSQSSGTAAGCSVRCALKSIPASALTR
jgi:hypothetical protein